jgi:NADH:ubiquinone oxidoreductase subunit 2 (subunit N)
VVATVVSLYYYLRLLRAIFMEAPLDDEPITVQPGITAAITVAVVGVVVLGLFPNLVLNVLSRVQSVAGL